jgi:hypothetical protein
MEMTSLTPPFTFNSNFFDPSNFNTTNNLSTMPIAQEPTRTEFPVHDRDHPIDPNDLLKASRARAQGSQMPSEVAPPTRVDTAPQQGSFSGAYYPC